MRDGSIQAPWEWYSMLVMPSKRKPSNWYSVSHHFTLDSRNLSTSPSQKHLEKPFRTIMEYE